MRLHDFEYIQTESNPKGKVLLVGMMEDGPTGTPFRLLEGKSARFLLGDNEISRTYRLLLARGTAAEDIILFRLNGRAAYATVEVEDKPLLTLQAMVSHVEENSLTFTVSEEGVSLFSNYSEASLEEGRRKDFQRTYLFKDYPYLASLAEAITKDAMLGFHNVLAENNQSGPSQALLDVPGPRAFSYGETEENLAIQNGHFPTGAVEEEGTYLFEYWQRFYHHLLGVDFDGESASKLLDIAAEVIYFADAPIDELPEVALLAGRIAQQKTEMQDIFCTALFRTSLVPKVRSLAEEEYLNGDGTFYNHETGEDEIWAPHAEQEAFANKLDRLFTLEEQDFSEMKHVQIVVGDERFRGLESADDEILAGASHHLLHLLTGELTAKTNQSLAGFFQLNAPLEQNVIDKLSARGYICIVESIRRHIVTSKVQSMHNHTQLIDRFYFAKMLSYMQYDIRSFLDQYIGGTMSVYHLVDIEDRLTEYLQGYVDARLIQSFALGERVDDNLEHSSRLSIHIVAYGELERIKGSAQLNESGWEVDLWSAIQ